MNPLLGMIAPHLKLHTLLKEFPGLAKLGHLTNLEAKDLSVDHLNDIARALNADIPVTEELKVATVAFLQGQDINSVCDLIQSPESVRDVIEFLRGGLRNLRELHAIDHNPVVGHDNLFLS